MSSRLAMDGNRNELVTPHYRVPVRSSLQPNLPRPKMRKVMALSDADVEKLVKANLAEKYGTFESCANRAKQGDPIAMEKLADMYRAGKQVTADMNKALQWYEKAADNGEVSAMVVLGDIYREGVDVSQDKEQAINWYEKASDSGHTMAKLRLGTLSVRSQGRPIEPSRFKVIQGSLFARTAV